MCKGLMIYFQLSTTFRYKSLKNSNNKDNLIGIRELIGILEANFPIQKDVSDYMEDNKTEWALKVFNSDKTFNYPAYITDAIDWIHEDE